MHTFLSSCASVSNGYSHQKNPLSICEAIGPRCRVVEVVPKSDVDQVIS